MWGLISGMFDEFIDFLIFLKKCVWPISTLIYAKLVVFDVLET